MKEFPTKSGTVGGTIFCILCNISIHDLYRTIVLAAVGAAVSFAVSTLLKNIFKHFKK